MWGDNLLVVIYISLIQREVNVEDIDFGVMSLQLVVKVQECMILEGQSL